MQRCRIPNCPGAYEEQRQVYAARYKEQLFVIDHVPMQVCDFCGDTLLTLETVRRLEQVRDQPPRPTRLIPLYDFADTAVGEQEQVATAAAVGQ